MSAREAACNVRDVLIYVGGAGFLIVLAAVNAAREQAANYRRWPGL